MMMELKKMKKKRVEEIGLFPLGMVLNPGAHIPLHIFEMRYRQLFNQAWQGDTKVVCVCSVCVCERERECVCVYVYV